MRTAYMYDASMVARRKKGGSLPSERKTRDDSEEAFLASYDVRAFERPSVAVDVAVLTATGGKLHALVVQRREHPHRGRFALPGGFIGMDESLEQAARRVLAGKAGLEKVFL